MAYGSPTRRARMTNGETSKSAVRQTARQAARPAATPAARQAARQVARQAAKQAARQAANQAARQAARQAPSRLQNLMKTTKICAERTAALGQRISILCGIYQVRRDRKSDLNSLSMKIHNADKNEFNLGREGMYFPKDCVGGNNLVMNNEYAY